MKHSVQGPNPNMVRTAQALWVFIASVDHGRSIPVNMTQGGTQLLCGVGWVIPHPQCTEFHMLKFVQRLLQRSFTSKILLFIFIPKQDIDSVNPTNYQ